MSQLKRFALGALAFLLVSNAPPPRRGDDRPSAEVMRSLRPNHPRLYVLDEEIDVIKGQIRVDTRCSGGMTGCKKKRRRRSRSRRWFIG